MNNSLMASRILLIRRNGGRVAYICTKRCREKMKRVNVWKYARHSINAVLTGVGYGLVMQGVHGRHSTAEGVTEHIKSTGKKVRVLGNYDDRLARRKLEDLTNRLPKRICFHRSNQRKRDG
jgi:hypothetical protein